MKTTTVAIIVPFAFSALLLGAAAVGAATGHPEFWPLLAQRRGMDRGDVAAGPFARVTLSVPIDPAACPPLIAGSAVGGLVAVDDRLTITVTAPSGAVRTMLVSFDTPDGRRLRPLPPIALAPLMAGPGTYVVSVIAEDTQPPTFGNSPLWVTACPPAPRHDAGGVPWVALALLAPVALVGAGAVALLGRTPTPQPPIAPRDLGVPNTAPTAGGPTAGRGSQVWRVEALDIETGEQAVLTLAPGGVCALTDGPLALRETVAPREDAVAVLTLTARAGAEPQARDQAGRAVACGDLLDGRIALRWEVQSSTP